MGTTFDCRLNNCGAIFECEDESGSKKEPTSFVDGDP